MPGRKTKPYTDPLENRMSAVLLSEQELIGTAFVGIRSTQADALGEIRSLKPHHFVTAEARVIYQAIINLIDRGVPVEEGALFGELPNIDPEWMNHNIITWLAQSTDHHTVSPDRAATILRDHHREREQYSLMELASTALRENDQTAYRVAIDRLLELRDGHTTDAVRTTDTTNWREIAAQPLPWLIPNWLLRGTTTVLGADGGTGKSFLALGLALQTVTGSEIWPGLAATERGPVLLLDYENDEVSTFKRMAAYGEHFDFDRDHLDGSITERLRMVNTRGAWIEPTPNGRAWLVTDHYRNLLEYCRKLKPLLIVVDHLRRISGSAEGNDNAAMGFCMELCDGLARECGAAILVLGHTNKAANERGASAGNLRGASSIRDEARCVWELRREDSGDVLTLIRTKANHASSMKDPLSFRMVSHADTVCLEPTATPEQYRQVAPAELLPEVIHFVRNNPGILTIGNISRRAGDTAINLMTLLEGLYPNVKPANVVDAVRLGIRNNRLTEARIKDHNRRWQYVLNVSLSEPDPDGPQQDGFDEFDTPPTTEPPVAPRRAPATRPAPQPTQTPRGPQAATQAPERPASLSTPPPPEDDSPLFGTAYSEPDDDDLF